MTEQEILEGKKLIADFMGLKSFEDGRYGKMYPNPIQVGNSIFGDAGLRYNSSWDWLMPVVEKIEAIKDSDDYEVDIFANCCDIGGKFEAVGITKIEATFKAVLQFLKWYDDTNPTT